MELNHRPCGLESPALPINHVFLAGFEPAVFRLEAKRVILIAPQEQKNIYSGVRTHASEDNAT